MILKHDSFKALDEVLNDAHTILDSLSPHWTYSETMSLLQICNIRAI